MSEISSASPVSTRRPSNPGFRITLFLVILWVVTTSIIGALLIIMPDRQGPRLAVELVFVAGFVWYLARTGPKTADLPDLTPLHLPWLGFWGRLVAILVLLGLTYLSGIISHPYINMTLVFLLIALGINTVWFRRLSRWLVVLGLAAGAIVGFSEYIKIIPPDDPSDTVVSLVFNVIMVVPLFLAGGLLLQRTGLARMRLLEGKIALSLRGFLLACGLALPGALANLGAPTSSDPWVDQWWKPLCALTPGIAEETWARLFLTTLCYALLRPTTNNQPRRAVLAAMLIGVFTHMAIHLPTTELFSRDGILLLLDGVVYGIPIAMLFLKRDFEHAVGYHFFIDFVRFLAVVIV